MRRWLFILGMALAFFCGALGGRAYGGDSIEKLISIDEFRDLAVELSKKVNLYQAIWEIDPRAEFFGGTSRDYLYWLRKEFQNLKSRDQALAKMDELRKSDLIDARDFLVGESDADVVSEGTSLEHLAKAFKLTRIDPISRARFVPGSLEERSEKDQGIIPVEKIRLGRNGFIAWEGFGDGLREIYEGRPTAQFSSQEVFSKTIYAAQKRNHRIFLTLRFLRILAMNYYSLHGKDYPNDKWLFDIDKDSEKQMREVIEWSLEDSGLEELLKDKKFVAKMNKLIQKMYRSYTNPTAAHRLDERFGMQAFHAKFSEVLETTNQYLFAKPPLDDETVRGRIEENGFTWGEIFEKPEVAFPGLAFYHGVKMGAEAYRNFLLQGALPSEGGSAGRGLYGVSETNKNFAIRWCGGKPERVVVAEVKSTARVVDISKGKGRELFEKYGKSEEAFSEHFGVQILKYPYTYDGREEDAFVVKDSAALARPRGMLQPIVPISEILAKAKTLENLDQAFGLLKDLGDWGLTPSELGLIRKHFILPWFVNREIVLPHDTQIEFAQELYSRMQVLMTPSELHTFVQRSLLPISVIYWKREAAKVSPDTLEPFLMNLLNAKIGIAGDYGPEVFRHILDFETNPDALFLRITFEALWKRNLPGQTTKFYLDLALATLYKKDPLFSNRTDLWRKTWKSLRQTGNINFSEDLFSELVNGVRQDRQMSRLVYKILKKSGRPWYKNDTEIDSRLLLAAVVSCIQSLFLLPFCNWCNWWRPVCCFGSLVAWVTGLYSYGQFIKYQFLEDPNHPRFQAMAWGKKTGIGCSRMLEWIIKSKIKKKSN